MAVSINREKMYFMLHILQKGNPIWNLVRVLGFHLSKKGRGSEFQTLFLAKLGPAFSTENAFGVKMVVEYIIQ